MGKARVGGGRRKPGGTRERKERFTSFTFESTLVKLFAGTKRCRRASPMPTTSIIHPGPITSARRG